MSADRNLLFGILAFQLNFIDRQALLAAFDLWTGDKGKAIGDIFVEMGELDPRYRELLDGLVAAHLEQHDGDAEKSVATSFGSLRDEARAALEGSSFGDAMAATVAVPQPENSSGASPGDKPQHDQSLAATVPYLQPSETDTATGPQRADRQAPKTRFGDYELVGEIARGGMGVVYKARQSKLNRVVALKMIKAGEFADANQVKRFHSEAEAAAKLDHPGIVPVHEVGEIGGQHFYSMAFVEGKSLNDRVKQDGPLAPRSAAQMIKSVAHAVHYAHSRGILHRDIKPQNILLDKDELTRVTDFGLAKHVEGTNELTLTGQVIGTPSYMPPEQANGAMSEIGPTSDVYSLGATLYFLLTGRPPFQTASTAETVRQVIEVEPVPLRRLNPAIPRDLETICLKCLRKEQVRRYPTAAALAADLGRWLEHKPIVARPFGQGERAWLWCKRRPAVAAMIGVTVVAILGSGIAVKLIRTAAAKRQAQTELAASRGQAKSAVEALLTAPAAAVPYTLANLQPLKEFCITLVRAKLDDPEADSNQQLHAAFALAHLGKARHDFLLDAIVTAPAGECGNLVAALAHVKERALQELARRALSAEDPETKARIAIIALQMGDPKPAQKALALGTDATDRTALIHGFAAWHGDAAYVAQLLTATNDPAFRSGLCAALGTITLQPNERKAAITALTELYTKAPDGGTHAAAGWALRQWKQDLPSIAPTSRPPSDQRWFVNGQGMTMMQVAAGKFTMGDSGEAIRGDVEKPPHEVTLTKPFYFCDREVTVEQFQRFMDDSDYSATEKPKRWVGAYQYFSPASDCPVQQADWFDAVLYCNWLSKREGRKPCFVRTGEKEKLTDIENNEQEYDVWRCNFDADGYRLPTEAEWEFACRAGSTGDFCFGGGTALLADYAWFSNNSDTRTSSGGKKLPNAVGLYDMHGNVFEWCWDRHGAYDAEALSDPTGPAAGSGRVVRGGSFRNFAESCRCPSRGNGGTPPMLRASLIGFRVCCGL